jgi:hypothetical protein
MDTNELSVRVLARAMAKEAMINTLESSVRKCGGLPNAYESWKEKTMAEFVEQFAPNGVVFNFSESHRISEYESIAEQVVRVKKYL